MEKGANDPRRRRLSPYFSSAQFFPLFLTPPRGFLEKNTLFPAPLKKFFLLGSVALFCSGVLPTFETRSGTNIRPFGREMQSHVSLLPELPLLALCSPGLCEMQAFYIWQTRLPQPPPIILRDLTLYILILPPFSSRNNCGQWALCSAVWPARIPFSLFFSNHQGRFHDP